MHREDVALEARNVGFEYASSKDFSLKGASLELRRGRSLALMGFNAQGKSTLCRMLGRVDVPYVPAPKPKRGRIFYYPRDSFDRIDVFAEPYTVLLIFGAAILLAVLFEIQWLYLLLVVVGVAVFFAARRWKMWRYHSRVVYITTEHDMAKHALKDDWPLAFAITSHLRLTLKDYERRILAERLLSWTGFRHLKPAKNDGDERDYADPSEVISENLLTCGELSGGQRHLVYLLRGIAPLFVPPDRHQWYSPKVDVVLLDEGLNCLDAEVRPRTIRLIRYLVTNNNVACLVVTQILHEISILCDDALFIDDGAIIDGGSAHDFVSNDKTTAQHPRAKEYVTAFWDLERDMKRAAGRSAVLPPCGTDLQASIAALPDLLFAGPPWEPRMLQRGELVTIRGLQAQQRFNGKDAVVIGPLDLFRFKVRLKDSQSLAVRRVNLVPKSSSPNPKEEDPSPTPSLVWWRRWLPLPSASSSHSKSD